MDALSAIGGFFLGLLIVTGSGLLAGFAMAGNPVLWLPVCIIFAGVIYSLSRPNGNGFFKGGLIIGLCVGGLLVGLCFNALRNI